MNILKIARKPYLSMFFATTILFTSCEQYSPTDVNPENNFDNSVFNTIKNTSTLNDVINEVKEAKRKSINSKSVIELNKSILDIVNNKLEIDIVLPNNALKLSTDMEMNEILNVGLENGWMDNNDIKLTESFYEDLKARGFDSAIENYEEKVIKMSLNSEEFAKKNLFVNMIKSMNYQNPNWFKTDSLDNSVHAKGWVRCAASCVALTAAIASASSCVTIVACGVALVCIYAASNSVADNC